jgi:hypothetical protein
LLLPISLWNYKNHYSKSFSFLNKLLSVDPPYPIKIGANFVFLVLEEGGVALAHHLPDNFVGNCLLASASATGCRLVEANSTSSAESIQPHRPQQAEVLRLQAELLTL